MSHTMLFLIRCNNNPLEANFFVTIMLYDHEFEIIQSSTVLKGIENL